MSLLPVPTVPPAPIRPITFSIVSKVCRCCKRADNVEVVKVDETGAVEILPAAQDHDISELIDVLLLYMRQGADNGVRGFYVKATRDIAEWFEEWIELFDVGDARPTAQEMQDWRSKYDLSRRGVARLLGVSGQSVDFWEKTVCEPRDSIKRALNYLLAPTATPTRRT